MPIPIQVAFQGGGARIVNLLGAAHALRELEKEGVVFAKFLVISAALDRASYRQELSGWTHPLGEARCAKGSSRPERSGRTTCSRGPIDADRPPRSF